MAGLRSALISVAASTAAAQQAPLMYTITGACDANNYIDGLSFIFEGQTLGGAPFYKAMGKEVYLYHDPDCTKSGGATPRWIIDAGRPNKDVEQDLSGDGVCNGIASVNSKDISRPPATGLWTMNCGGKDQQQYLILAAYASTTPCPLEPGASTSKKVTLRSTLKISTTEVPTTEEATSTAGAGMPPCPGDHLGSPCAAESLDNIASTTETVPSTGLILNGACPFHEAMNGAIFDLVEGTAADGSPYYKARDMEEYIYYDIDCDGSRGSSVARWIIDESRPDPTLSMDLDNDQECNYHARLDSSSSSGAPPRSATWTMFCGANGWEQVQLTLTEATASSNTEDVLCAGAQRVGSAMVSVVLLTLLQFARSFVA